MDEDYTPNDDAKFNMALACLERLNTYLKYYTEAPFSSKNMIELCQTKHKIIRQLFMTAVPLIKDKDQQKKIKERIDKVESSFSKSVGRKINSTNQITSCSDDTERTLDDIFEDLQQLLQKDRKMFLVGKGESSMF